MEYVNVSGKCRACSIKTQKEFQIPIFATENLQLIFHEATSLEIHENDGLPGILCEDCHKRLVETHKFRQMCASSALAFRQLISGDGDSDFEEKYKPPEVVGVPGEKEVMHPVENSSLSEEKFHPLEALADTVLIYEEGSLSESPDRKQNRPKGKRSFPKDDTDPLKDDPDWTYKAKKGRKKQKNSSQSSSKEFSVPADGIPEEGVNVKEEPKDDVVEEDAFVCKICGKKYGKKESLKSHMRSNHKTERGLIVPECNVCGKKFKRSSSVKDHMVRKHSEKENLKCRKCEEVYSTAEEFASHEKEWHDPKNPKFHVCEFCAKEFTTRKLLRKHKKIHNESVVCALCGKMYVNKDGLRKHMGFVHQRKKVCECKVCGRKFTRPDTLRGHMVRKHGASGMLKCLECGTLFCTQEGLSRHMITCHDPENPKKKPEKKIICEHCGRTLWSKTDLMQHLNSHAGILPFKCKICPRGYSSKHLLKVHMMRHEGIKNHVCTICGLRKTTLTELKTHMNIHTKERTFPCSLCSRVFLNTAGLSRHTKVVHQAIKAFECPHCERSFGKKETLKHHVMTHTGEKPHGCNICGKRFIQPTALQTHMKTHQKFNLNL